MWKPDFHVFFSKSVSEKVWAGWPTMTRQKKSEKISFCFLRHLNHIKFFLVFSVAYRLRELPFCKNSVNQKGKENHKSSRYNKKAGKWQKIDPKNEFSGKFGVFQKILAPRTIFSKICERYFLRKMTFRKKAWAGWHIFHLWKKSNFFFIL